ncbi:FecCD family ABC transporter permease [Roseospirillum parvum]|uniref:Iron complex transport system permease protein n=1 Tax=Roseospirillum parvum TaxID=83401 RepID=A0A1G8AP55_9PROT|nr:iron chelate uptake ABC transporter family permease subunit [Roseospirillum parvum]SDH22030.1 iron complex transport system permease protein [Roseospirillum parvum]
MTPPGTLSATRPADALRGLDRQAARQRLGLIGLGGGLLVSLFLGLGLGAVQVPPAAVLSLLAEQLGVPPLVATSPVQETVLLAIRLPRALLAVLVGAALAVAGAALQGLFRNPLADPSLIGVSTGAALAAGGVIVLGGLVAGPLFDAVQGLALPLAAFLGGLATTALAYRIANRHGQTQVATLLLAGIALNAMAGAGIGLLIFLSDDQALRDLNFWMLGSLGGITWERLLLAAPLIIAPTLAVLLLARPLNALLFGETEALHLGFDVEAAKRWTVVLVALAVGAAVALSGVIGFVGLVVPHLIRLTLGPDHRVLLPAAMMLGASLLLLADLVARTVVLPAELPIGIVTSCLGGPFFIWLLLRRRVAGLW